MRRSSIKSLFVQTCVGIVLAPVVFLILPAAAVWTRRFRSVMPGAPAVLSFSQVIWADVWQRPQEFASHLAAEVPTVYCSPVQIHNWIFTLGRRWRPAEYAGDGRLLILSPLVFSGHYKSRVIFEINSVIMSVWIRLALTGRTRIHCIVNTCLANRVVEHVFFTAGRRAGRLRRLIYDLIDDFAAFDWAPKFSRLLEKRLIAEADVLFTGTYELFEMHRAAHPESEFIPCGVDFDLFNTRPAEEPDDIRALRKPIIGYFGSISERIDWDLIRKVAEAYPESDIAMIGPMHLSAGTLPDCTNIRFLGLKRHEELSAYAACFAVALIPFRLTEATLKLNPVKTLEYLAAGVPVVSTAIPDVQRFFSEVVAVAADHEEFVRTVGSAMKCPDQAVIRKGIEMARNASWAAMSTRMKTKLMEDTPSVRRQNNPQAVTAL